MKVNRDTGAITRVMATRFLLSLVKDKATTAATEIVMVVIHAAERWPRSLHLVAFSKTATHAESKIAG